MRLGRFKWPGVLAPVSGSYTISHGIAPGTAILECLLQDVGAIAEVGDLIITDDVNTIKIPDCKVDKIRKVPKGDGFVLVLEILDWRWKWTDLGTIEGWYNQLDQHGKLRPYTIRSPEELAKLCFKALNVGKYQIDLPAGLTEAQVSYDTLNPIWAPGENTAPTATNPPVDWEGEPPALALSNLVHQYGRHIVPRLSDYTITVVVPGFGRQLPPGSIARRSPTFDSPETPSGVAVLGDYTRYQVRLLLEAVAEDWNGRWLPIKDVSYAPRVTPQQQINTIVIGLGVVVGEQFAITIRYVDSNGTESSKLFIYTVVGGDTATSVASAFAALINADPIVGQMILATSSGGTLQLKSYDNGVGFEVNVSTTDRRQTITNTQNQKAISADRPWQYSDPPSFRAAQTDQTGNPFFNERLTYDQAIRMAQHSVFRDYRIRDVDVALTAGGAPINIPQIGELKRKQQIILTDHQVEQIAPERQDLRLVERDTNQPYLVNLYNGYSRDKPAAVYGRIAEFLQNQKWSGLTENNTPAGEQIFVPFTVDPENQLVRFNGPVYIWRFGGIEEPERLVLQCAVLVRNEETNAIERFKKIKLLESAKGLTKCVVRKFPDVQLNVIGLYNDDDELVGEKILEEDPITRADYYLKGMEAQYFPNASETVDYNGFELIDLDGAITQVTWEFPVREGGCGTTASRNTEHEVNYPPYFKRRREENLSPAAQDAVRVDLMPGRDQNDPMNIMRVRPPGFNP